MKSPLITVKWLSISYHQAPSAKPLQPYHYFPAEGQGGTATKSWRRRVLNGCAPPMTPGKGTLRSSWFRKFRSLEVSVVRGLWSTNLIYDIYIYIYAYTHTRILMFIYYIYMIIYISLLCIYIYCALSVLYGFMNQLITSGGPSCLCRSNFLQPGHIGSKFSQVW